MKKVVRIISIMMICLLVFAITVNVNASTNPVSLTGDPNYDVSSLTTLGNQIIQIISVIGSIASVIMLVVLGIKYMMGSAEEKAEYKKTLMPYVIGAAMVFAASTIAAVIFNFTNSLG